MPGVRDWLGDRVGAVWDEIQKALPVRCPIPWRPNALAPVFYGYRDLRPGVPEFHRSRLSAFDGDVPTPARVVFPSLDGSPESANILWPCGQYPLIVFCHGHCPNDENHYLDWANDVLVAQLARSGYVVLVPHFPGISVGNNPATSDEDLDLLQQMISWIRTSWVHAQLLAPEPHTGLIGHSWGASLAARLAEMGGCKAFASLSGAGSSTVLRNIAVPKLFTWGSDALTDTPIMTDQTWEALPRPKHRVVIDEIYHFDYLPAGVASCERGRGPCARTRVVAADLATTFFGRYLPPPAVPVLPGRIPPTLIPPELDLTPQQQFFAGGHLRGFSSLESSGEGCHLELTYVIDGSSGSVDLP